MELDALLQWVFWLINTLLAIEFTVFGHTFTVGTFFIGAFILSFSFFFICWLAGIDLER